MTLRHAVITEQAGNNFSAYVPDPQGCVANGATLADAEREIRAAIAFHVEGPREDGLPVPEATMHAASEVEHEP